MRSAITAMMLCACTAAAPGAAAQQRYAIIVAGASGGTEYAEQYAAWTGQLATTLRDRFSLSADRIVLLAEGEDAAAVATASNVRKAFAAVAKAMQRGDSVFVFLVGHGTFDGVDAKFNLVGPDLEAGEWATLLQSLPGSAVVVNTTAASFPFLERLASPRRVVITATDSPVQRFDTQFAGHFISALADEAGDLDKNGRVSIWEAFVAASAGVRRYYEQRGQLATERPLLDDNGDGIGSEAGTPGQDGATASRTYLGGEPAGAPPTDDVLVKLLQRRMALQADVEELKVRKSFMPAAEYEREFERIIIELARVSRDIRQRGGKS